jgi:hypothetical protein
MDTLIKYLTGAISGKSLSCFRLLFGVFMAYEMLDYMKIQLVKIGFLQPGTLFQFSPFEFLEPLPLGIFKFLLILMFLATLFIAIGLKTKVASFIFGLGYLYIILLEKAYYNNHLYLFMLISFLLAIVDSEEHYSIGSYIKKQRSLIPRWHKLILQFQFIIVYLYGGITKLGNDWLIDFEPVKSMRKSIPMDAWYSFIKTDAGLKFFMYGGLILDLLIAPLLFHRKLKWIALPLIVIFNFLNTNIFNDIGIFPYVMLASLILFFDSNDLQRWYRNYTADSEFRLNPKPTSKVMTIIMGFYVIFQLLFPFRGYLYNSTLDWSGHHQSFSWRMKSMAREIVEMKWIVVDDQNKSIPITHGQMINNLQVELIARNAKAVLDFARYIKKESLRRNISNPRVYAKIRIKFNGRPAQYFVKPDVDLSDPRYNMSNTKLWLESLKY